MLDCIVGLRNVKLSNGEKVLVVGAGQLIEEDQNQIMFQAIGKENHARIRKIQYQLLYHQLQQKDLYLNLVEECDRYHRPDS